MALCFHSWVTHDLVSSGSQSGLVHSKCCSTQTHLWVWVAYYNITSSQTCKAWRLLLFLIFFGIVAFYFDRTVSFWQQSGRERRRRDQKRSTSQDLNSTPKVQWRYMSTRCSWGYRRCLMFKNEDIKTDSHKSHKFGPNCAIPPTTIGNFFLNHILSEKPPLDFCL